MIRQTIKPALAALAVVAFAPQTALAAHTLGDASVYTTNATILSGGGDYGAIAAGTFDKSGNPNYTLVDLEPGELPALMGEAADLSTYYKNLTPTAFTQSGGVLHGVSGVNVIDLTGATLSTLSSFAATDATLLILNISGAFNLSGNYSFGGLSPSNVLFNFYDGSPISLSGNTSLGGTVLAPGSAVNLSGNVGIDGSLIADSLRASGNVHIGGETFSGLTPNLSGVPEPSTWALLILGFGLVGAALRRKQQPVRVTYA